MRFGCAVRPEELLWLIHEQSVFFIQALKNLNHIFSKQKKVGEEKNWSLFSIFRLVRVSDFLAQNFFGLVILFYLSQRKLFTI